MPRALAVSALMALAIGAVVLAGVLIIPAVVTQAVQFSETAPDLFAPPAGGPDRALHRHCKLEETLAQFAVVAGRDDPRPGRGAWRKACCARSPGLVSALVFMVVTPVVAFYLLLDWERLVRQIDDLLPRQHAPVLRHLAGEIDASIAGFVRGQVTVCLILAAYYATALG